MSCTSSHHFHKRSFLSSGGLRFPITPEELPSFRESGQAPNSLHRVRRSFRQGLIDWRYRIPSRRIGGGRSRTFTGQCCQPLCPGDSTKHPDGPSVVTKSRPTGERSIPKASAGYGAWPIHQGRNVTPPRLSSPDPSDTGCCLPALVAYPLSRFE